MKFVLDTNVFVDAFRDEAFADALSGFLEHALPWTYLSAVVVQELAAGARTPRQVRALEFSILRPFQRRLQARLVRLRGFQQCQRHLQFLDD